MKYTNNTITKGSCHMLQPKLTFFTRLMGNAEDNGNSMKNALYAVQYTKKHLSDLYKAMINSEKIKPVALAIIKGISHFLRKD